MMLAGKNAVVTGGAGFIGSELVRQLAAAGAQVTVLDNFATGDAGNVADVPRVRVVRGDVRSERDVSGVLGGKVDALFHLACLGVRHSIGHPMENHEVNATGTLRVLERARAAGVARVVHVSTSEVYGDALHAPMTEEHPAQPKTIYGASKLAGETYARAFQLCHGLPVVIVRPFNSYGPRSHAEGDSGEVIPRFALRLMRGEALPVFGDGRQTRDFTFVSDTAKGIMAAGLASGVEGKTINLGSGSEVSILELGAALAKALDVPPPRFEHFPGRPGDVRRLMGDATCARALLHWKPRVSLEEGLRTTADWMKQHWAGMLASSREPVQNWITIP